MESAIYSKGFAKIDKKLLSGQVSGYCKNRWNNLTNRAESFSRDTFLAKDSCSSYRGKPVKLLDRVRHTIRTKHYSRRTENAYIGWIRRYILFHGKRHPNEMAEEEITIFLSHLATMRRVSASTQNQALSAILFLYKDVLGIDINWLEGIVRAKRPVRIPAVLSRNEVRALFAQMRGKEWIMASLMYGAGLRLMECIRLRIKDVTTTMIYTHVLNRGGKGVRSPLEGL